VSVRRVVEESSQIGESLRGDVCWDIGSVPTLGSRKMLFLTDFHPVCLVQNLECTRLVSSYALFKALLPTIPSIYWPIWSVLVIA
jgi:hypothetical protein